MWLKIAIYALFNCCNLIKDSAEDTYYCQYDIYIYIYIYFRIAGYLVLLVNHSVEILFQELF